MKTLSGVGTTNNEAQALKALHDYKNVQDGYELVPEHVETRRLYHPDNPGMPQVLLEFNRTMDSYVML